jgi:hypothetical protein
VDCVRAPEVYDPCVANVECPDFSDCWRLHIDFGDAVVTDDMCSRPCVTDENCPFDGFCSDASLGPALCFRRCVDDLDCPSGFACIGNVDGREQEPSCMPF